MGRTDPHHLKRLLGGPTALLIGMGVAIGSGIFRTPGEVAQHLHAPWIIVLAWLVGGFIVLMQGLVSAELVTRFPHAGGEYVFLREAYGRFVAFFFGWAYTIVIIGGGAALIAIAFGEFACLLFRVPPEWARWFAAGAIVLTTGINTLGLRTGATAQNLLTAAKIVSVLALVAICFAAGSEPLSGAGITPIDEARPWYTAFLAALLPILWSYDGTTDSVKLAEEVKDVRRAMPRAIIGCTLALMLLYVAFNVALMRVVPIGEMGGDPFVPGNAMDRVLGPAGRTGVLIVAMLVCLGAIGSTVLATIRVTFALARDGLTFRFLSKMSNAQAPVAAYLVVGTFSVILVMLRGFEDVLGIYFFASAILFGLSYGSLIIFRRRESAFPETAYRCPVGIGMAVFLIVFQLALAVNIAWANPWDVLLTVALLLTMAVLFFVWRAYRV